VGFQAGGFDVGVKSCADLSLRRVEFGLKGGLAGSEFVVESEAEVGGAFSDFGVEGFAVLVDAFFH
jgi:hypothetical protein